MCARTDQWLNCTPERGVKRLVGWLTSQEQERQRRSFACGNAKIENKDITPEAIETAASALASDDSRMERVTPGLLAANFFDHSGSQQRPQQIHGALLGYAQCTPYLRRSHAAVVAEQLE